MFITLQFPLFDKRGLNSEVNRVSRPNWYNPESTDKIRYMGAILDKNSRYIGPWDGEKYYCNASSVINLCGLGDQNFFNSLKKPVQSKLIFRRFQSDGHFMAKYEIGWTDQAEDYIKMDPGSQETGRKNLYNHIRKYLECQVKIKTGNKLSDYLALGDAHQKLKAAYYWATVTGSKTFNIKDLKYQVEGLDPVLIIHLDSVKVPIQTLGLYSVPVMNLGKNSAQLYFDRISFKVTNNKRYIDTWIIGTPQTRVATPDDKKDFVSFPEEIKNLRMNLLKITSDAGILRKLNSVLQQSFEMESLADQKVQRRISVYLHKSLLKFYDKSRNNQDQKAIVNLSMAPETGENSMGEDLLKKELVFALAWFKSLPPSSEIENMRKMLEEKLVLPDNDQPKEPVVYFSYAWGDPKDGGENREKLIEELYNSLSKDGYTVKRDKMDLQYGGLISKFMQEIGKGDLIVIALTSKYLKSTYCMWELCEIYRNSRAEKELFTSRILPLHIETLNLDSITFLKEHLEFWEQRFKEMTAFISQFPQQVSIVQYQEVEKIKIIKNQFAEVLGLIKDINAQTLNLLKEGDFMIIKETISRRTRIWNTSGG